MVYGGVNYLIGNNNPAHQDNWTQRSSTLKKVWYTELCNELYYIGLHIYLPVSHIGLLGYRKIQLQVTDQQDGTYLISFVPDTSGNLSLSVSVQGKPIQVNYPFSSDGMLKVYGSVKKKKKLFLWFFSLNFLLMYNMLIFYISDISTLIYYFQIIFHFSLFFICNTHY